MKTRSIKNTLTALAAGLMLIAVGCSKKDVAPPPQVNFTYIVLNSIPPARVEFSNHAVNATSYTWDFGDNTSSTTRDPEHFYTKAGTYVVTLRAAGNNGTEQKQYQLTVGARSMLIRNVKIEQVPGIPDTATFYATVKYDGGGYLLPDFSYTAATSVGRPLAIWGGERFYGVPLQTTLELQVFYRIPGRPNPVPVGDNAGVYKIKPIDLTTGANAHPTNITLESGSGLQKSRITLSVAWE